MAMQQLPARSGLRLGQPRCFGRPAVAVPCRTASSTIKRQAVIAGAGADRDVSTRQVLMAKSCGHWVACVLSTWQRCGLTVDKQ